MNVLFDQFRITLDHNQATRERIIKASRDITASSKKIIFAVQRISNPYEPIPQSIQTIIDNHWKDIKNRFEDVKKDLTGSNQWRYQRNMSGCIQECIEAISFQHYILNEKKEVITIEQIRSRIPNYVLITDEDYILGLMDLTGELMRYAISHLAESTETTNDILEPSASASVPTSPPPSKRHKPTPITRTTSQISQEIITTLRNFQIGLLGVDIRHAERSTPGLKELSKKVDTFKSSLSKVEQAICSLSIQNNDHTI